jgi:PBP1b-binding outer membrane lipoprotein LpoB
MEHMKILISIIMALFLLGCSDYGTDKPQQDEQKEAEESQSYPKEPQGYPSESQE